SEFLSLYGHWACRDRVVDRFRGHLAERGNFGRVRRRIRISVARHAILLEYLIAHLSAERGLLLLLRQDPSRRRPKKTSDQSRTQHHGPAPFHDGTLLSFAAKIESMFRIRELRNRESPTARRPQGFTMRGSPISGCSQYAVNIYVDCLFHARCGTQLYVPDDSVYVKIC